MVDQGCDFNFFRDVRVETDIRIDIAISIRPMTTKLGKHVHLEELTQMRLIKQGMVTSLRQDDVKN